MGSNPATPTRVQGYLNSFFYIQLLFFVFKFPCNVNNVKFKKRKVLNLTFECHSWVSLLHETETNMDFGCRNGHFVR